MFKKTMTFYDLEDKEVTKTFYFNYDKLEVAKMLEFDQLEEKVERIKTTAEVKGLTEPENTREAYDIFEELIAGAYGVKSDDNLEFDKSAELTRRWKTNVAFPELIFEMLADTSVAAEFMEKCLPARLIAEAKAEQERMTPASGQIVDGSIEVKPTVTNVGALNTEVVTTSKIEPPSLEDLTEADIMAMDDLEVARLEKDIQKLSKTQMVAMFRRKTRS